MVAAADAVAVSGALTAAVLAAGALGRPVPALPAGAPAGLAAAAVVGWLALFAAFRLYDGPTRPIAAGGAVEAGTLLHALVAGSLPFLLAAQAAEAVWGAEVWTPLEAVLFVVAALLAVPAMRAAARALMPHVVRPRRAIVVGARGRARRLRDAVAAHPEWGLEIAGFVDDNPAVAVAPLLGRTSELTRIVDEHAIEWVLVASSRSPREAMLAAVAAAGRSDVRLALVAGAFERATAAGTVEDLGGIAVVTLPTLGRDASADQPIPLHPAPSRDVWGEVRLFLRAVASAGPRRGAG